MTDLYSENAERAVVGAVMHGRDLFEDCATIITRDDFQFGYCRRIWDAVAAIVARGEEPDVVLTSDEIRKSHPTAIDDIGGDTELVALSGEAILPNMAHHATIVADRARRRRLIGHSGKWGAAFADIGVEVDETLAEVERVTRGDVASHDGIEFVDYRLIEHHPEWEAIGLIPKGISVIFGADQAGKSFLALDLACRMASGGGPMVGGWRVADGPVAYIAAEGQTGIKKRVRAWEAHHHTEIPTGRLMVHGAPVELHDPKQLSDLSRKVGRLGARLLVVDTLSRCFGGHNENETQDMRAFLSAIDKIRTVNDCSIIVIHHSGWDDKRIRGNSTLKRDVDAMIHMSEEGGVREIVCQKMKDEDRFSPWRVRMVASAESVVLQEVSW